MNGGIVDKIRQAAIVGLQVGTAVVVCAMLAKLYGYKTLRVSVAELAAVATALGVASLALR